MNMARLRNCTIGLTPHSHYTARFKLSLCITVLLSGCLAKLGVARGCRGGIAGGIMGVTPHSPTHIKRTHTLASERRSVCFLGVQTKKHPAGRYNTLSYVDRCDHTPVWASCYDTTALCHLDQPLQFTVVLRAFGFVSCLRIMNPVV